MLPYSQYNITYFILWIHWLLSKKNLGRFIEIHELTADRQNFANLVFFIQIRFKWDKIEAANAYLWPNLLQT